ncbi:hypothetical protein ACMXYV_06745 [Neptuniibacter sp. SY11_33]|uniref:hypothetical protein n=1 Tax=Neptuniibacter sp. SY11_33 TaxID=3398215 RepID=UPI0039F4CA05
MDKESTATSKHYERIEEYDEHGRLVRAEGYIPPEHRSYQSDYTIGDRKKATILLFPYIFLLALATLCLVGIFYFTLPLTLKIILGIFA